jgi:hypothetical protein
VLLLPTSCSNDKWYTANSAVPNADQAVKVWPAFISVARHQPGASSRGCLLLAAFGRPPTRDLESQLGLAGPTT